MAAFVIELPLNIASDGSDHYHPARGSTYTKHESGPHHEFFLEKLARLTTQGQINPAASTVYKYKNLPHGYAVFTRTRSNGNVDRYIFGHSCGKFFDSPSRFLPHLQYLIGETPECECVNCVGLASEKPTKTKTKSYPKVMARAEFVTYQANILNFNYEFRTVFAELLRDAPNFQAEKVLSQSATDHAFFDGGIDGSLPISRQHGIEPRLGEVVIFCCRGEVCHHPTTYQLGAFDKNLHPCFEWRAGVVNEIAGSRAEVLMFKGNGLTDTLRVKTGQILPFSCYYDVLRPIPEHSWHSSINRALDMMSTTTFTPAVYIARQYPKGIEAYIPGVWIGSEFIVPGDCIRVLQGHNSSRCCALLQVGFIFLEWVELEVQMTGPITVPEVRLGGRMLMLESGYPGFRSTPLTFAERLKLPSAIGHRHSTLYPKDDWENSWKSHPSFSTIPAELFLARLYDQEGQIDPLKVENYQANAKAIVTARIYGKDAPSNMNKEHFDESIIWRLGDNRAAALGMAQQKPNENENEYGDGANILLQDDTTSATDRPSYKLVISDARSLSPEDDNDLEEVVELMEGNSDVEEKEERDRRRAFKRTRF